MPITASACLSLSLFVWFFWMGFIDQVRKVDAAIEGKPWHGENASEPFVSPHNEISKTHVFLFVRCEQKNVSPLELSRFYQQDSVFNAFKLFLVTFNSFGLKPKSHNVPTIHPSIIVFSLVSLLACNESWPFAAESWRVNCRCVSGWLVDVLVGIDWYVI